MTIKLRLTAALVVLAMVFLGCAGMGAQGIRPAPGFEVALVSGGWGKDSISFNELKGRPLVLNIGAIWCPHCLHELPAFREAYEKYKGEVVFLMVFIKSERKAIEETLADKNLSFMVGHDENSDIGKAYGIKGIPVTLFIDPYGYITDEYVGGITESRLSEKTEALIARSRPQETK